MTLSPTLQSEELILVGLRYSAQRAVTARWFGCANRHMAAEESSVATWSVILAVFHNPLLACPEVVGKRREIGH